MDWQVVAALAIVAGAAFVLLRHMANIIRPAAKAGATAKPSGCASCAMAKGCTNSAASHPVS